MIASCGCEAGYEGAACDTCAAGFVEWPAESGSCVDDPCAPDPCTGAHQVAGSCEPTGEGAEGMIASCGCEAGYEGAACDTCAAGFVEWPAESGSCVDDPCAPDPCTGAHQVAGSCEPTGEGGIASCSCVPGMTEWPVGGGACVEDPCAPDPCTSAHQVAGSCKQTGLASTACSCEAGFDGASCAGCAPGLSEWPPGSGSCSPDPCQPDPCSADNAVPGSCARTAVEAFMCACKPGFFHAPAKGGCSKGLLAKGTFGFQYQDLIPEGVDPAVYDPTRVAVITGLVHDHSGAPMAAASISVHDHPELGVVATEASGQFSLLVNGGGLVRLVYDKADHVLVHRKVRAPWRDVAVAPTVRLIQEDTVSTAVVFDGSPDTVATHRASEVTDAHGTRSTSLVFRGDNAAYELDDQGKVVNTLDDVTVRATEYHLPDTMPAALPGSSGYTYCVELSVDGIDRVGFDQPVVTWVENFLDFPVGGVVPVGHYDRDRGVWVPQKNGVVVRLLDTTGDGLVDSLDADGDGEADDLDGDGATSDEVEGLGDETAYPPDASFWRMEMSHFSPKDPNWPRVPKEDDAEATDAEPPETDQPKKKDDCPKTGSIVESRSRVLHQNIPIPGTGLALHYTSSRVQGYRHPIVVPASGASVPASLKAIVVRALIAGRTLSKTLPPEPNQTTTLVWDGLDHLGRRVAGQRTAVVSVGFQYEGVYVAPGDFAEAFGQFGDPGVSVSDDPAREDVLLWRHYARPIVAHAAPTELGNGWSLSNHQWLDPTGVVHRGDGTFDAETGEAAVSTITTVAGTGDPGFTGDGGMAIEATLDTPAHIGADAAGNLYIPDCGNSAIRKVDRQGVITTVAGSPPASGFSGDGGPATDALLDCPLGVALDPAGNLYFTDHYNDRVRKVDTDGIITTVAGGGEVSWPATGDGGLATDAALYAPTGVDVDSNGNLYIMDWLNARVRKVDTNGRIHSIAGTGWSDYNGDGIPAVTAEINGSGSITVDAKGNVFLPDTSNDRVRKIDAETGVITTVAGNGSWKYNGDGIPATGAGLCQPMDVEVDAAGNLYIASYCGYRVRKVDTQGFITTVAGNGDWEPAGFGDGGPAVLAGFGQPAGLALDGDGNLFIAFNGDGYVRKVAKVASTREAEDGMRLTADGAGFDEAGRHVASLDRDSGVVLGEFSYDANDRLASVMDRFGNTVEITRDAKGAPTQITSPFGVTTLLELDAGRNLTGVSFADGGSFEFEYGPGGLMVSKVSPNGGVSKYAYDGVGRVTETQNPAGGTTSYERVYKADGTVETTVTDPEGTKDQYAANTAAGGNTTLQSGGAGVPAASLSVSADGLTETRTLPDGTQLQTTYGVDPEYGHRVITTSTITVPSGLAMTIQRDKTYEDTDGDGETDRVTASLIQGGHVQSSVMDRIAMTFVSTSPEGRKVTVHLDDKLQPTKVVAAKRHDITYTYDPQGRPLSESQGEGEGARTITHGYDARGLPASTIDPLDREVGLKYDAVGRLVEMTFADGRKAHYAHDAVGNLVSLTPPGRPPHTFEYDVLGRNTGMTAPSVDGGPGPTWAHAYDSEGKLVSTTLADGRVISYGYDALGRVWKVESEGDSIVTERDPATGQVSSVTAPSGVTLSFEYDGDLKTKEAVTGAVTGTLEQGYSPELRLDWTAVGAGEPIGFEYDADGHLSEAGWLYITRDPASGDIVSTALGSLTTQYIRNGFGELTGVTVKFGETVLYEAAYEHDGLGRVVTETETIEGEPVSRSFEYALAGDLKQVAIAGTGEGFTIELDENRNRIKLLDAASGTTVAGSYDVQDRMNQYGNAKYVYGQNGELITRTDGLGETSYSYDMNGHLQSVELPGGSTVEYVIDGWGRRVGRKKDGAMVGRWLYLGFPGPSARVDAAGEAELRYVYGVVPHTPAYMAKDGKDYLLVSDYRGSIRLVVDAQSGEIAQRIDYDVWGRISSDTNPGFQDLGFSGALHDPDTGLVHLGHREYDPEAGRFTRRDPLGFGGGDSNLYRYADGDPVNRIDPTGLDGEVVRRLENLAAYTHSKVFSAAQYRWANKWNIGHPGTMVSSWLWGASSERRFMSKVNSQVYGMFFQDGDKIVIDETRLIMQGEMVAEMGFGNCGARAAHLYRLLSQQDKGKFCGWKMSYADYYNSSTSEHAFLIATSPDGARHYQVDPHSNLVRPVGIKGKVMNWEEKGVAKSQELRHPMMAQRPIGK